MKRYMFAALFLAAILATMPIYAATYNCTGTVTQISVNTQNFVQVTGVQGLNNGYLCQLGATSTNGYTAEGCKAAYATLLAARLTGQQVTIVFTDSLTCSTQPQFAQLTTAINLYF